MTTEERFTQIANSPNFKIPWDRQDTLFWRLLELLPNNPKILQMENRPDKLWGIPGFNPDGLDNITVEEVNSALSLVIELGKRDARRAELKKRIEELVPSHPRILEMENSPYELQSLLIAVSRTPLPAEVDADDLKSVITEILKNRNEENKSTQSAPGSP